MGTARVRNQAINQAIRLIEERGDIPACAEMKTVEATIDDFARSYPETSVGKYWLSEWDDKEWGKFQADWYKAMGIITKKRLALIMKEILLFEEAANECDNKARKIYATLSAGGINTGNSWPLVRSSADALSDHLHQCAVSFRVAFEEVKRLNPTQPPRRTIGGNGELTMTDNQKINKARYKADKARLKWLESDKKTDASRALWLAWIEAKEELKDLRKDIRLSREE